MRLSVALAAAMFAAAALPGSAGATTVHVEGNAVGPYPIGDFERDGVVWYGAGITQYRYTGVDIAGGDPVEFLSYCVDFLAPANAGFYDIAPLGAYFPDAATQNLITVLLGNATALEHAAAESDKLLIRTATQLAIWEIAEETSGILGTTTGSFKALDADGWPSYADARDLADDYLARAATVWTPVAGVRAQLLYDDELQSSVFLSGVPEPTSWATMIGGFALAGGAIRRRRVRVALA